MVIPVIFSATDASATIAVGCSVICGMAAASTDDAASWPPRAHRRRQPACAALTKSIKKTKHNALRTRLRRETMRRVEEPDMLRFRRRPRRAPRSRSAAASSTRLVSGNSDRPFGRRGQTGPWSPDWGGVACGKGEIHSQGIFWGTRNALKRVGRCVRWRRGHVSRERRSSYTRE